MNLFEIARKDFRHSLRSMFLLVFAFGLPLLTTGVFYAAFGGLSTGKPGGGMTPVKVAAVNLEPSGIAGRSLLDTLSDPALDAILDVTIVATAEEARAAVDAREAAAAVIIPADFSSNLADPARATAVILYADPGSSAGTAIVQTILEQALDGFHGAGIAAGVTLAGFSEYGLSPAGDSASGAAEGYAAWFQTALQPSGTNLVILHPASDTSAAAGDRVAGMVSTIMAMMLVFYCFFTGASAAQSILQEQEDGTLPRLFTTPTPRAVVLGGKMLSVLAMLLLQVTALALVAALAFGIRWGNLPSVMAAIAGTTLLSAGFGIFLTSFLKSTKQAGVVFSVVVNLTGWIGIIPLFAGIIPGMAALSGATAVISLLVPQGWAARIWQESLAGNPVGFTLAGMLLLSAALFAIGIRRFQLRFAA